MEEGIYSGVYKGRNKFGFVNGNSYEFKLMKDKKRGYGLMTNYDLTNDIECKLFCPYSSETSIRTDWRFE